MSRVSLPSSADSGMVSDVLEGFFHARHELVHRGLAVLELGRIDARQACQGVLREVAGELNLLREREHVGREPGTRQYVGIEVASLGTGHAFFHDMQELSE